MAEEIGGEFVDVVASEVEFTQSGGIVGGDLVGEFDDFVVGQIDGEDCVEPVEHSPGQLGDFVALEEEEVEAG